MLRPVMPLACLLTPMLLAAAVPAQAQDPRLVTRRYDASQVVRIDGRAGVQASIAFAEDELVENVAIGDSSTWQVTPNKRANLLFIKPLAPHARTNMTVVTDRHTYYFDLVAAPQSAPLYVIRFAYPDEPRRASAESTQPVMTEEEAQALAGKVQEPDPARLNFAWRGKGKAMLIPSRIYDDGQATYLSWNPQVPIPAIQVRDESGTEGPVNYAVRGDVIVLDQVPTAIVLRAGKDTATLERVRPSSKTGRQVAAAQEPSAPASSGRQ